MAEKILKGINFPGLEDTYIIPEVDNTLNKSGSPADAKAVGDALATKQPLGNYIKSINGNTPDENGNIEITVDAGEVSEQVQSDWSVTDGTDPAYIKNKPNVATQEYVDEAVSNVTIEVDSDLSQEGKAADAKAVGDALSLKQPIGNYVKSINGNTPDENGNVTIEVGSSDSGGSSEQVQSDWNVTDETDPAYIKNKPEIVSKEYIDNGLAGKQPIGNYVKSINGNTPDENGNIIIEVGSGDSNTPSTPGEATQSDWSVTDETDPAYIKNKPFGETPDGVKKLDNKYLSIMETTAKDVLPEGNAEFYWDSAEEIWRNDTYVVSSEGYQNLIALYEAGKKLDVEIGSQIYSADITAGATNDDGSYSGFMIGDVNHVNYPFWITITSTSSPEQVLMPTQDVELQLHPTYQKPFGAGTMEEFGVEPFALTVGETYIVTWDEVEYTVEAGDASVIGTGTVGVGDGTLIGLPSSDDPFMIGVNSESQTIMIMALNDTEAPYEHSFSIKKPGSSSAPFCSVWLKEDMGEPGEANIFPEQDVAIDTLDTSFGQPVYVNNMSPLPFTLELGATYRVVWGTNSYTLPTVDTNGRFTGSVAMGDGSAFGYPPQDAPFIILYNPKYDVVSFISLTDTAPATYSIAIYKETGPILSVHAYTDKKDVIKQEYLPANSGGSGASTGSGLPAVTAADAGKFLRVTDEGVWAAVAMLDVSEVGL